MNSVDQRRRRKNSFIQNSFVLRESNKNSKSYVCTNTAGGTSSKPSEGGLQIKQEPVGLSEAERETHGNEEEDHILNADLREEGDLIKERNATIAINPDLLQSI